MAWVAVDKNGTELISDEIPNRANFASRWGTSTGRYVELPSGSIEKLIGRKLSWTDEPVELT